MTADVTTDVDRAASVLRGGGLVAFATETVYGLGADAENVTAVARVFEAKGRPRFDPLIVHIADAGDAARFVREWPSIAGQLAERYWPGPLTLVLPKSSRAPDLVTAGLPNVALRVPGHPLARDFIRRSGRAVAAPSANRFGQVSPTTAAHVLDQLSDRIDLVLDGGPCRVGVESTVIDLTGPLARILRPGGVTREELSKVLGYELPLANQTIEAGIAAAAPGMLRQHYAPRTPVELVPSLDGAPASRSTAVLGFQRVPDGRWRAVEVLSETGDLREAAARFFAALRRLDACGADRILAAPFPDVGLGLALNDRLRRAAAQ